MTKILDMLTCLLMSVLVLISVAGLGWALIGLVDWAHRMFLAI